MKYAIIGYPVKYSLSPEMHEAGFQAAGLDAEYHRIPVQEAQLAEGIEYLKKNGYAGWNVTYPLKELIIPYLDEMTEEANHIGAVNTVKAVNGSLVGHNTDGGGFIQALQSKNFDFRGKRVVILGAGGAAKAIALTLAHLETSVLILNRTIEKATVLAEQVCQSGGKASAGFFGSGDWLEEVDLLIQTTPIGMKGEEYSFDLNGINPSAWVVDIIYHPARTLFLENADANGCRTMNGLDMLLFQGALAWKFWLNREAPISRMQSILLEKLASRE